MKTRILILILMAPLFAWTQNTFQYPLNSDFGALQPSAPTLVQIPNNSGLTGQFVTRQVPLSTCPQGGDADGYFYEDDAGLEFDNPVDFIDCEYSLEMIFQVDEFISPPPWVRLLSFTHTDDVGIYIYLSSAPDSGTLDFWPFGLVGDPDFFKPADFYQLTLTRQCSGLITIYINGAVFSTYDDTLSQAYIPQDPNNYIMFFRDHPSVLANEASPGFVSNIQIADYAWTEQMVLEHWENFCPTLTGVEPGSQVEPAWQIFPNPARAELYITNPQYDVNSEWRIVDVSGKTMRNGILSSGSSRIDLTGISAGYYFFMVNTEKGASVRSFEIMPE